MADATSANQILSTTLSPKITEAFNLSTVISRVLPVVMANNPDGPSWVVNKGGATAATHGEGSTIDTFSVDEDVLASLGIGLYEQPFKISDELISKARYSPNPKYRQNMFSGKLRESVQRLAKLIEQDFISGVGANSIVGFDEAFGSITNEYAGIDRSTGGNEFWHPYVSAPGVTREITKSLILDHLAGHANYADSRPNVAFCNPLVYSKIQQLFLSETRYDFADIGGPLPHININGTRFIETPDGYAEAGNGSIYFVDTSVTHIEVMPYDESPLYDSYGIDVDAIEAGGIGAAISLKKVPVSAHVTAVASRTQVQLVVSNPRKCGVLADLDIS